MSSRFWRRLVGGLKRKPARKRDPYAGIHPRRGAKWHPQPIKNVWQSRGLYREKGVAI